MAREFQDESAGLQLTFSARRTAQTLLLVVLSLVLLSIAAQVYDRFFPGHGYTVGLFSLADENSIPTWYSSLTLLFCSVLLAKIAAATSLAGGHYVTHWRVLAACFLFLSLDEALSFHERTTEPLRTALGASGFLYYTWVVLGAMFVAGFGLTYLRFLAHLPTRTRNLFLLGGGLYVAGGLGTEAANGKLQEAYGRASALWMTGTVVEESLEMLGIIVFIYALISYASAPRPIGMAPDELAERNVVLEH